MANSKHMKLVVRGEVMPEKNELTDLIEDANLEYMFVEETLGRAIDHAVKCGEALAKIRRHHITRGWETWVDENFMGGHVVASYYMRIAEYKDLVDGLPNVTQAMKRLRGMPALREPGYEGHSEEVREEARTLVAEGMSKVEVARMFGVSANTIRNWVDPEALKRHRVRVNEQSRKRREETRQKKREALERKAARDAKRVGGVLAEAYSLVHKLEAPLAMAARDATNPEIKKALDEAVGFQHMVLYRIVTALGAS
jgi:transposase